VPWQQIRVDAIEDMLVLHAREQKKPLQDLRDSRLIGAGFRFFGSSPYVRWRSQENDEHRCEHLEPRLRYRRLPRTRTNNRVAPPEARPHGESLVGPRRVAAHGRKG
jgi:hypothetical protein